MELNPVSLTCNDARLLQGHTILFLTSTTTTKTQWNDDTEFCKRKQQQQSTYWKIFSVHATTKFSNIIIYTKGSQWRIPCWIKNFRLCQRHHHHLSCQLCSWQNSCIILGRQDRGNCSSHLNEFSFEKTRTGTCRRRTGKKYGKNKQVVIRHGTVGKYIIM